MITLITGGIKSGKSLFAEEYVKKQKSKKIYYVATSVFMDDEMRNKIKIHQLRRPLEWKTIEEGHNLEKVLKDAKSGECYLIDCLTVYVSTLVLENKKDAAVMKKIKAFIDAVKTKKAVFVIVTNEVGSSVINENKLARRFCDALGIANQMLAAKSKNVYMCVSGVPVKIKGKK